MIARSPPRLAAANGGQRDDQVSCGFPDSPVWSNHAQTGASPAATVATDRTGAQRPLIDTFQSHRQEEGARRPLRLGVR